MGLPPTGKIVARPMVARSCGHMQEFQHYAVDKYRAQRLAKFQQTRCPDCAAKLVEEQRQKAPLPASQALRLLPAGSQVSLTLQPDGAWGGSLMAEGTDVQIPHAGSSGPQAVVVALARLWLTTTGNDKRADSQDDEGQG
jgi:hypothetical protein